MAEALIGGILDAGIATPNEIRVGEPISKRRSELSKKYKITAEARNIDVLDEADIIILSIKPQSLSASMSELGPNLSKLQTVLSIVAGIRIKSLEAGLAHKSIIRVMPNTPAQIRAGMSVWTASPNVPERKIATSREILQTLGEELYVSDENLIDMATAISASGPAYVFLFIEALIDAGVYLGMSREMANKLVLQTLEGSTKLMRESGRHPADLKNMVSSPGGGTVEALMALEQGGFRATILEAIAAAYEKYQTLGKIT